MNKESILNLELNFELVDKKYYLTLAGKRLKTKLGNEIFADSIMLVQAVQEDYNEYKFKSKWINLISSYVDFVNTPENIEGSKKQIKSYLKNDLLFYVDEQSSEFYQYQKKTYLPLIAKFKELLNINQNLVPTTGFGEISMNAETLELVNSYVECLNLKDLFISLFLSRISTSAILTIFYLNEELNAKDFYDIAFYSEIIKITKSPDDEEVQRLKIIKEELDILNYFKEN
ncbi:MAG TPA: hypothetical protein DCL21_04995 [Alphaproteobacteria bacterium]|nr:hypothetical protein [Alphaproteobacteria bacterium]